MQAIIGRATQGNGSQFLITEVIRSGPAGWVVMTFIGKRLSLFPIRGDSFVLFLGDRNA